MKKLISFTLFLLVCLCAATALGDVVPFESLGATIDIPEGMILQEGDEINPEVVEETGAFAIIFDEANQAFVLFSYIEDDEVTAIDLAAMTPDEVNELAALTMTPYEVKEALVVGIDEDALLAITFLDEANAEQNMLVQFYDGGFLVITFAMVDNSQMPEEVGARLVSVINTLAFAPEEE